MKEIKEMKKKKSEIEKAFDNLMETEKSRLKFKESQLLREMDLVNQCVKSFNISRKKDLIKHREALKVWMKCNGSKLFP